MRDHGRTTLGKFKEAVDKTCVAISEDVLMDELFVAIELLIEAYGKLKVKKATDQMIRKEVNDAW